MSKLLCSTMCRLHGELESLYVYRVMPIGRTRLCPPHKPLAASGESLHSCMSVLRPLLFTFASLHIERRQRSLIQWVLKRKTTAFDSEAADFDGDGIAVAAEFVIYKLKEMGKISQDDITPIMDEFETHDFDKTGTLSAFFAWPVFVGGWRHRWNGSLFGRS
ncbi:two-pore potassium channel 1-like protein [Tanacetum coccineum]|uniref:Two-pore potassium channel 1-like protein n=1 Tax=Tanacetum coccineum TaxID=301880 RepID=A0ABQ5GVB2_9ASTR